MLALLFLFASCGEEEYGFKNNPLNVLQSALRMIQKKKFDGLNTVLSKVAFCSWSTPANAELLHHQLSLVSTSAKHYDLKVTPHTSRRFESPRFVGFWSYYMDDYLVTLRDKATQAVSVELRVECDFGITGTRNDIDKRVSKMRFPEKSCKIVELTPHFFTAPPVDGGCAIFSR